MPPKRGTKGPQNKGPLGSGRGGTAVGIPQVSLVSAIKTIGVRRDEKKGYGQAGRKIPIQVNAFTATIPEAPIHHYDVVVTPGKLPARVNQQILKALQAEVAPEVFATKGAYDGRSNLFCASKLLLSSEDTQEFQVPLAQASGGTNPTSAPNIYRVKLTHVATINPEVLQRFVNGKHSHDSAAITAITACNVALRQAPALSFVCDTRSFFIPELGRKDIGGGFELWRGLFQSFRPCPEKAFVNVDITTGVMYKAGPLMGLCLEVLADLYRIHGQLDPKLLAPAQGLEDATRLTLSRFFKGVRVTIEGGGERLRVVRGFSPHGATEILFDNDGKQTSVEQYFNSKLGKPLQYPSVVCVEIGQNALIPLELCTVPPGQIIRKAIPPRRMDEVLKFSKMTPQQRFDEIRRGVEYLQHGQSEYIHSFGVSVNSAAPAGKLMHVEGRVIPAPAITYANNDVVKPRDGTWNVSRKKVFQPCRSINHWAVVIYETEGRFIPDNRTQMVKDLLTEAKNLGITFGGHQPSYTYQNGQDDIGQQLLNLASDYQKKNGAKLDLIIVILPNGGDEIWTAVKYFGDVEYGVATQCLISFKCKGAKPQFWANVLLKINVKLNGINCLPSLPLSLTDPANPTIIIGADVAHPSPGAEGRPSTAAVVSSVDKQYVKYTATSAVQAGRQEIIGSLKDMIESCLDKYTEFRRFKEQTTAPPRKLIFFRDGVSEGQFSQVIAQELKAIKDALKNKGFGDCQITFIVVGKRHHIRFNPVNPKDRDRTGNAPAGLVVDRGIGHPLEFDFYLQSQGGLLGTSRSSHYSVLYDDNKFNADAFQALAFALCHSYARATRSVSIPAPVYYADLVCGRAHTRYDPSKYGTFRSDTASQASSQDPDAVLQKYREDFKPLSGYAERAMYFS